MWLLEHQSFLLMSLFFYTLLSLVLVVSQATIPYNGCIRIGGSIV